MNVPRSAGIILLVGFLLSGGGRAQNPNSPGSAAALPGDIYPDSKDRLPLPQRNDMDEYGQQVLDGLTGGKRLPASVHSIRLYSPAAKSMEETDHYLNFETGLPAQLVEIAILVTAREMDSQYEWTQNELHGRDRGDPHHIDPAIIDTIKYGRPVRGLGERETAIIALGREMIGQRRVSSKTFAEVLRLFGRKGTVDLVELMANYSAAALELSAFNQQLKEGQAPLLSPRSMNNRSALFKPGNTPSTAR
jgi:4-carboxymuconolactone decarboxylase